MLNLECETLLSKIKATARALDRNIADEDESSREDISALSLMLLELINEFDEKRKATA